MDLKDKLRKNNGQQQQNSVAPFRPSGSNKSSFIQPVQNHNFYNHQTPQSVKYQSQPEYDELQPQFNQQSGYYPSFPQGQASVPMPQENFAGSQQMQQNGFYPPTPLDFPSQGEIKSNQANDVAFDEINSFLNGNNTSQQGQPIAQDFNQPVENSAPNSVSDFQPQDNIPTDDDISNFFTPSQENDTENQQNNGALYTPQNLFSDDEEDSDDDIDTSANSSVNEITLEKVKTENAEKFKSFLISLFERYDIKKYLIVNDKIYTVNFEEDANDDEIYEEFIDKKLLDDFVSTFASDGFYKKIVNVDKKIEVTASPVSDVPIISVSKIEFNYEIDDDFVRLLFEFINEGKNILVLSPYSSEFMFKTVSDYLDRNLCVTINEPIVTSNNIPFNETKDRDSIKTIFSIAEKIEPDNTLIYSPNNLAQSIKYMQRHKGCLLFSKSETPSDFINSDVMSALCGFNEYNRVLCLKSIDIVFSFTKTKSGSSRFTATQLLSASNKSNINKIKKIIGEDGQIDTEKIYFLNVFDKEI